MTLLSIIWDVNPVAFSLGSFSVRWYGIMWAVGIYICYLIQDQIYKKERCQKDWIDKLFTWMVVGVIVGARLGHCFFYEWHQASELGLQPVHFLGLTFTYRNLYIEHPLLLLKIWEGGLASHGGAIGLILAGLWLNHKYFHTGFNWIFDRLVIGVAITGLLIRFGNLMNSEIYGGPTNLPWGFVFVQDGQTVPCHPTQIYEMIYCAVAFVVSALMYWKTQAARRPGLIFGVWLIIVFFTRFCLEFIKNDQEAFEAGHLLNMGQILSIPFVIWGIYLIIRACKRPMQPEIGPWAVNPSKTESAGKKPAKNTKK